MRGADRVLAQPASRRLGDTGPHPSDGRWQIVVAAKRASPEEPVLVIARGPLTTVANALLTNPEMESNLVVFNRTIGGAGYNGQDGRSACIVAWQVCPPVRRREGLAAGSWR